MGRQELKMIVKFAKTNGLSGEKVDKVLPLAIADINNFKNFSLGL